MFIIMHQIIFLCILFDKYARWYESTKCILIFFLVGMYRMCIHVNLKYLKLVLILFVKCLLLPTFYDWQHQCWRWICKIQLPNFKSWIRNYKTHSSPDMTNYTVGQLRQDWRYCLQLTLHNECSTGRKPSNSQIRFKHEIWLNRPHRAV